MSLSKNLYIELDDPIDKKKDELGRGSYGKVYKVKYKGIPCVAKMIIGWLVGQSPIEGASIPGVVYIPQSDVKKTVAKFRQECLILSQMKHPNVVKFIGLYENSSDPRPDLNLALVMERLHIDLYEFIKQNQEKLAPPSAAILTDSNDQMLSRKLKIILDVCRGLLHIHSHGVIHRDLNARNVLLTESFQAKVADLGVARIQCSSSASNSTPYSINPGAVAYMPPEASSGYYGKALDVFSLGHLMLCLVTGDCHLVPRDPPIDEIRITERKCGISLGLQAQRRRKNLNYLGDDHSVTKFIVNCLCDRPEDRPKLENMEQEFSALCLYIAGSYESYPNEETPHCRFEATMVLGSVGDALGYKNGAYESCKNGAAINGDVMDKGGVEKIRVNPRDWMLSDDSVMHIGTAEALVSDWDNDYQKLYLKLAERYKVCMHDMTGRSPGNTCLTWTHRLNPKIPYGHIIPFNPRGGGCGAAMRAVPIGLYFNSSGQIQQLVAVSIESGRMTHNHPTGYLGALAVALFISYAYQRKPLIEWGAGLMNILDIAWEYIEREGRDVEENRLHWSYFKEHWEEYLKTRGIKDGCSFPTFPVPFDAKARDIFYKRMSFSGWGGSSGHDAPMIAYDALLGCEYNAPIGRKGTWAELCSRGMFHGGDSDSTGIITGACWGAMKGYTGVPQCNYKQLEYRDRLEKLAKRIHDQVM